METRRISQKQIAALAGVDQSAVSHALRGTGTLKPATRDRILQLCQELNYHPNAHAQSLRTRQSNLVGVVTGRLTESFHAELVHELMQQFTAAGYHLMLRYCAPDSDIDARRTQLLSLLDRQAAGIVIATVDTSLFEEIQQLTQAGIPLVMVGATAGLSDSVSCNRFEGGRLAAEHLIACKKSRLAILQDPRENIEGSQTKSAGFDHELERRGGPVARRIDIDLTCHPQTAGYRAIRQAINLGELPDALFCESDDVAIGAMQAFLEHGIRVPEDVAIVGFDDTPQARMAPVPLTTIRQPIAYFAQEAARLLIDQMQHGNHPKRHRRIQRLNAELIVRRSTDPNWQQTDV